MAAAVRHVPTGVDDSKEKRILFLGDGNIGKTTFIKTYCRHMRRNLRVCTGEGAFSVFRQFFFEVPRGGRKVLVRLLDLPAGTTAETRRGQYPSEADMIVLCFAVDDPASFDNVSRLWLPEVRRMYADLPFVHFLGLRKELRECEERRLELSREGRGPVSFDRGFRLQQEHGFRESYMEISTLEIPQHATYWMDMIITRVFQHEPGSFAY